MLKEGNMNKVIQAATKRRATLIKRLHYWQARNDAVKCDQIILRIQGENAIISNIKEAAENV